MAIHLFKVTLETNVGDVVVQQRIKALEGAARTRAVTLNNRDQ